MTTDGVVKDERSHQNRPVSQVSAQGPGLSCLALGGSAGENGKGERAGSVWLRQGGLFLPEACHHGLMLKVKPFCISPLAQSSSKPQIWILIAYRVSLLGCLIGI